MEQDPLPAPANVHNVEVHPEAPVFTADFLVAIRGLIGLHHSIYRRNPPQGIYFEALVNEAFRRIKKPFTLIERGRPTLPGHDLLVEDKRISLKTETGAGTRRAQISITKLCTTEREPWTPEALIERVLQHLDRYDMILMLRGVWENSIIHYQLVEISVRDLKLIDTASLVPVGRRKGRQSLGADVQRDGERLFHVHFDGSDGKCQIRNLDIRFCRMLEQWDTTTE